MSTVAQDIFNALPEAIEPRWWTGSPALPRETFTIDCAGMNLARSLPGEDSELGQLMNELFDRVGLVHLVNTGLSDVQTMRRIANLVVRQQEQYVGGANPRDKLEANVYEVGAPLEAWLHYHHEMAYIGHSTRMIGFLCKSAVVGKGFTYVSDNLQATDAILATDFGQKLKDLGVCYHRDLTDREAFAGTDNLGVYNHWQQSMMTDRPDEAEAVARSRGLKTEWGPHRLLKTRYYASAFEYFPPLDRNLLYSSVADDGLWFDSWPKVMHLPHDQRPLKLTFGDGSEMTREEKHLFMDVYDRFGIPIRWNPGEIVIMCNYRFAHGRPAIHLEDGEKRELGVLIGESYERVGDLPGKW